MSANDDPYRGDTTETSEEGDTDSETWIPWTGGGGLGWPYRSGSEGEADRPEEAHDADDDGWLDEGIIGTLLVVGVVLFLVPEPSTSALGILLIVIGVLGWAVDAVSG
ncbi:hypothetical protein ACFQDG_06910 [Natronoarchaeum mannanilyticum]|uniref:Uncharacterized protein n=1 Tax=Natronoarchaeum mannanilyticum TaxID=926360 RepID=A0AAV3T7G2_9EURY